MSDFFYLSFIPDPFGVRNSQFCLLNSQGHSELISSQQVSQLNGKIITFEIAKLIDILRLQNSFPPPNLISIEDALHLCAGNARDEGGQKKWSVWPHLFRGFTEAAKAQTFKDFFESRADWRSVEETEELLSQAALALKNTWDIVFSKLEINDELQRFLEVEIPVRNIFNYRQFLGLAVNADVTTELLEKVSNEKYRAFQAVANAISRSPSGLNFWNIHTYLGKTDAAYLSKVTDQGNLRDNFKIASHISSFARDFLAYSDASADESIIQRAIGRGGRLFPIYQIGGTVTSRILVSDPYLQQLRKAYRSLIAADQGKKLVYLDFSQFEPGILAFLSDDNDLIKAYNSGDLYTNLSLKIYGSSDNRALSKRIFLAFSYGMTSERIALLVSEPNTNEETLDNLSGKILEFFAQFPSLEQYKKHQIGKLSDEGFVDSLLGNKRYKVKKGTASYKEQRWALNHPIQATASLIFKEALIGLSSHFGNDSLLLPIHDAILMQFEDNQDFEGKVSEAKQIMINAYEARCPSISARVQATDFSEA